MDQVKNTKISWKPLSLRAPMLLSIACVTMVVIVLLEYFSWVSQRDGGIALINKTFSGTTNFLYRYFPVLLATCYSSVWSWIDLDAKRLEPYFQMSKQGGALSQDSVSLEYPFEFIALAPFKALRRRHWSVFCSGTAMVAVLGAITPLVGSVFNQIEITRSTTSNAMTVAELQPVQAQSDVLEPDFLFDAWASMWINQSLPNYTTTDVVLAPFIIDSKSSEFGANVTWTATTTMYSTNLSCKAAIIAGNLSHGFTFDDGNGCWTYGEEVGLDSLMGSEYLAISIGSFMDPLVDYTLQSLSCENALHSSLAIWAGANASTTSNLTAIFCEPAYYMQTVNATVSVSDSSIIKISPTAERSNLSEAHFNASNFEYIISLGIGPDSTKGDVPQTDILVQGSRMRNVNLKWLDSNMAGFAVGVSRLDPSKYLNVTKLASSFERAHQLLFTFAMRQLLSSKPSNANIRAGIIEDQLQAVVVIRPISIVIETVLGLIVMLTMALLWISKIRASELQQDPASLSEVMALISDSSFESSGNHESLEEAAEEPIFSLKSGSIVIYSVPVNKQINIRKYNNVRGNGSNAVKKSTASLSTHSGRFRPKMMSLFVAGIFISILLLAISCLTFLRISIKKNKGLPLPSKSSVTNQIILYYLPISFATFLKSFWILLNRLLCTLRPFEKLLHRASRPSQSLKLKYTSLPPPLIVWRALRAGHFILAAVCATSLLANLLSVSLNGLFIMTKANMLTQHQFGSTILPKIHQASPPGYNAEFYSPSRDHFYVLKTHINDRTPLPPWITADNFFLPFDTNTATSGEAESYSAVTTGFGVDLQCTQLKAPTGLRQEGDLLPYTVEVDSEGNEDIRSSCTTPDTPQIGDGLILSGYSAGTHLAAEIVSTLQATNQNASSEEALFCNSMLLVAFLRLKLNGNNVFVPTTEINKGVEATYLGCRPTVRIASFNITINLAGRILDSTRQGPYATDIASFFGDEEHVASLYRQVNALISDGRSIGPSSSAFWHSDTFASSWFPYLIKATINSSAPVDPSLPPPSPETLIPVIQSLYAQLFAIILGSNTGIFLSAPPGTSIPGEINIQQTRFIMSQPMFIITMTLLGLNIVVALIYYVKRPKRMLRRMPTTIGNVLELFEGSGLVTEVKESGWQENWKIGYGRFNGVDGKPHTGIERRPFVLPLGDM